MGIFKTEVCVYRSEIDRPVMKLSLALVLACLVCVFLGANGRRRGKVIRSSRRMHSLYMYFRRLIF